MTTQLAPSGATTPSRGLRPRNKAFCAFRGVFTETAVSKRKRDASTLAAAVPRVAKLLTEQGHRHALIGGLAIGVWVEPRATKDIDFIVSAKLDDVDDLLKAARQAGFEVDESEVARLKRSHMTRVWTNDSSGDAVMIDLLLNEHPFYESLLQRSRAQRLDDQEVRVASPEDVLLLKVIASRPQDIADAAAIVETYGDRLDRTYLEQWARELEIEADLHRTLARHDP